MKKINFPLLLGGLIVIFLIIAALFPRLFTSRDPVFEEPPKYIEYVENGKWVEKFQTNPIPPNKDNILGTDDAGRDLYASLVYGTRNTLKLALLVALFRMAIALPLGIAAGMGLRFVSGFIRVVNTFFTAIPMLIFSYLVLNIGYFKALEMDRAIPAFATVLTIAGWAKLSGMIEDSTRRVMEEDFIEGEIATGKTKLQIALQNVLPHIIPESVSLFFKEIGMVLFLIAQLAVLQVFVGVSRRVKALAFRDNYDMILEPEWGALLSRIQSNVTRYESTYWITIYPVLALSLAITGINLFGEGLRIEFQRRESRVISLIKKAYFLISPRVYISQLKNIRRYYRPVIAKTLVIIGVITCILIPWNASLYKFNIEQASKHLEELIKGEYSGRIAGTEGGYLAGEYIINNLKSYGYQVDTMEFPIGLQSGPTKYPGRNIIAFLPGKGKTKEVPGELIIVGAAYDGLLEGGTKITNTITAVPAAIALEVARTLSHAKESLEKSVQIIFWDSEYGSQTGAEYYRFTEGMPSEMESSHGYYYFDICFSGFTWDRYLDIVTAPPQISRKNYYLLGLELGKRMKHLDIPYRKFYYEDTLTGALKHMRLNALASVGLGDHSIIPKGNPYTEELDLPENAIEKIDYKKMEGMGQIIVDTLTMNPHVIK